ncbi:MAG TPA: helix-turn-helix domain-containing protein [Selenomonadales bacterium]|nr:helix-turn-helix domain-containing protein [Selenomonadales bacterium]
MRTKERILNATVEIIQSRGLQAATVGAVSARAEANRAAVSYYFGSKRNLVHAAQAIIENAAK